MPVGNGLVATREPSPRELSKDEIDLRDSILRTPRGGKGDSKRRLVAAIRAVEKIANDPEFSLMTDTIRELFDSKADHDERPTQSARSRIRRNHDDVDQQEDSGGEEPAPKRHHRFPLDIDEFFQKIIDDVSFAKEELVLRCKQVAQLSDEKESLVEQCHELEERNKSLTEHVSDLESEMKQRGEAMSHADELLERARVTLSKRNNILRRS